MNSTEIQAQLEAAADVGKEMIANKQKRRRELWADLRQKVFRDSYRQATVGEIPDSFQGEQREIVRVPWVPFGEVTLTLVYRLVTPNAGCLDDAWQLDHIEAPDEYRVSPPDSIEPGELMVTVRRVPTIYEALAIARDAEPVYAAKLRELEQLRDSMKEPLL